MAHSARGVTECLLPLRDAAVKSVHSAPTWKPNLADARESSPWHLIMGYFASARKE